jgi:hypothetical protein
MAFNDRDYTYDAIMKQLGLVELHTRDGSAVEAGCHCIETKHLRLIEGLSEEGVSFAVSEKEKAFFKDLGDLARSLRKNMELETFDLRAAVSDSVGRPVHTIQQLHSMEKESPTKQEIIRCMKEGHSLKECQASLEE